MLGSTVCKVLAVEERRHRAVVPRMCYRVPQRTLHPISPSSSKTQNKFHLAYSRDKDDKVRSELHDEHTQHIQHRHVQLMHAALEYAHEWVHDCATRGLKDSRPSRAS